MPAFQRIHIEGFYNDSEQTPLRADAVIAPNDEAIPEGLDDQLFYRFDPDETVVGDHGDFTVVSSTTV